MNNTNLQKPKVSIVGAGLAGSECALQLAHKGFEVHLYEMRGKISTPAHKTTQFGELVCSNSLGSFSDYSAPGHLKWEAEQLGSFLLQIAKDTQVPAGQALAVDRELFASQITQKIQNHPDIYIHTELVENLENIPRPAVIATGPLTHETLGHSLQTHFGKDFLYFYDAIAPIVDAETINWRTAYKADRYNIGTQDYYNCPMDKDTYYRFIDELLKAEKTPLHDFEKTPYFEGCMPVEAIAERGPETLRYGPMNPKGLRDPRNGRGAYAVVQLRRENKQGTAYNMVGFQTKMIYSEQVRVFRMIPGLEKAEFLKLGSIHRNLYMNSPKVLNANLSSRQDPDLFFAGQMTGVEGYFESICIGLLVSLFVEQKYKLHIQNPPPRASGLGSLIEALTNEENIPHFQPTNFNLSLLPMVPKEVGDRRARKALKLKNAREALHSWLAGGSSTGITSSAGDLSSTP